MKFDFPFYSEGYKMTPFYSSLENFRAIYVVDCDCEGGLLTGSKNFKKISLKRY